MTTLQCLRPDPVTHVLQMSRLIGTVQRRGTHLLASLACVWAGRSDVLLSCGLSVD